MYHVYVSLLKEMAIARDAQKSVDCQEGSGRTARAACESGDGQAAGTAGITDSGKADLALSRMFMDFGNLGERISAEGIFDRVLVLDERRDSDFPDLMKYKKNHHNIVRHMINRMIYTKKYGKLQEKYIDIDFTQIVPHRVRAVV